MLRIVGLLTACLLTPACQIVPSAPIETTRLEVDILDRPSVPFSSWHFGSVVASTPAATEIVRTSEELDAFNERHQASSSTPALEKPPIDFATEDLLVLVLPIQPSSSIRAEIVAVEELPDRFVVHTVKWRGMVENADFGSPIHVVSIKNSHKPVEFKAPVVRAMPERPCTRPWPEEPDYTIELIPGETCQAART